MSLKRILFIALCALLVIVLILTIVAVVKVVGLFRAPDPIQPSTYPSASQPSTEATVPSSQPTQPSSQPTEPTAESTVPPTSEPTVPPTSEPTVPPTSEPTNPTEEPHVHDFELVDSKAATCTESGWRDLRCKCGETKREPVEKLPHTFGYGQTIPATCEEGGCTRFTCSACGAVEDRNLTEPLGHNYDAGVYFPQTCTEGDYTVYTCTNPNCPKPEKVEQGSNKAQGHKFGNWNENAQGILQQTCSVCQVSHTTEDLLIQADLFTEMLDENNKLYKLHEIWVGTTHAPYMYRYVIIDAVSQGSLENRYDYETGLSVTFIGVDGKEHTTVLGSRGDQATLELTQEPPATEPSTEATQAPTEATQPSTEATQPSTEATQPSTEATQPSTEATQPSTEATQPSTEATQPSTEATQPSTEATQLPTETTQPTESAAATNPSQT